MNSVERITRHSETSEKAIESYLRDRVRAVGGLCLKYSNPGETGYPDRLVVFPTGAVVWVELKSKGKHPSKIQQVRIDELRSLGQVVYVADCREIVDGIINSHSHEV